jgi:hypothetical protein
MIWTAVAVRAGGQYADRAHLPWRAFAEAPTCTRRVVAAARVRRHQVRGAWVLPIEQRRGLCLVGA